MSQTNIEAAIKLRDSLGELIDSLFFQIDKPEVRSLIDEVKEIRRQIIGYIRNPNRFDDAYLRAVKLELREVVEKARKYH